MVLLRHQHSRSSPATLTPATTKQKKRAGHPMYRGVRRKNGGTFPSPETAAVAHDVAAPQPQLGSHQDIQRAASDAAREFCPGSSPFTFMFPQEKEVFDSTASSEAEDSTSGFVDEEAVFNLPALLDSMAEGMLLTPLALKKGFNWSEFEVDDEQGIDLNLWGN